MNLRDSCVLGNVKRLRELRLSGVDLNQRFDDGIYPIHLAVFNHRKRVVSYIGKWCFVNAKTEAGDTALDVACRVGNLEMVRILKTLGCLGSRAIMYCCKYDYGYILPDLIDYLPKDNRGRTALHHACFYKNESIVENLLSLGMKNTRDKEGKDCIDYAMLMEGEFEIPKRHEDTLEILMGIYHDIPIVLKELIIDSHVVLVKEITRKIYEY